jgi:hypothetical protein
MGRSQGTGRQLNRYPGHPPAAILSATENVGPRPPAASRGNGLIAYEALARAIVARHLQTEMMQAESVDWHERPADAAQRLADLNFDQAPVTRKGKLIGFVVTLELRAALGTRLSPHVHALGPDTLTSATASVREVMDALLPNAAMTFVVDGHHVSGFVTPSDLNRHPARAHFYLLLADLEMALAGLVRDHFADLNEAVGLLYPQSQGVVRKRFATDRRNNLETDLVAGMDLAHLLRIVGSTSALLARFGADEEETWSGWTHGFRSLRDAVMHPALEFLGPSRSLADLVLAETKIRRLLEDASSP